MCIELGENMTSAPVLYKITTARIMVYFISNVMIVSYGETCFRVSAHLHYLYGTLPNMTSLAR